MEFRGEIQQPRIEPGSSVRAQIGPKEKPRGITPAKSLNIHRFVAKLLAPGNASSFVINLAIKRDAGRAVPPAVRETSNAIWSAPRQVTGAVPPTAPTITCLPSISRMTRQIPSSIATLKRNLGVTSCGVEKEVTESTQQPLAKLCIPWQFLSSVYFHATTHSPSTSPWKEKSKIL